MPGLIQRFPGALLPLLSIKEGETPRTLADVVLPSLEMFQLYTAERLEVVAANVAAISAVQVVLLPVPAGEFWYVHSLQAVASTITVGSSVKLSCGITDRAGANVQSEAMLAPVVSIAGELFSVQAQIETILPPGFNLFASTLVDPGAGTLDLACRALIARLQSS